jgi:hypothetical protein
VKEYLSNSRERGEESDAEEEERSIKTCIEIHIREGKKNHWK